MATVRGKGKEPPYFKAGYLPLRASPWGQQEGKAWAPRPRLLFLGLSVRQGAGPPFRFPRETSGSLHVLGGSLGGSPAPPPAAQLGRKGGCWPGELVFQGGGK